MWPPSSRHQSPAQFEFLWKKVTSKRAVVTRFFSHLDYRDVQFRAVSFGMASTSNVMDHARHRKMTRTWAIGASPKWRFHCKARDVLYDSVTSDRIALPFSSAMQSEDACIPIVRYRFGSMTHAALSAANVRSDLLKSTSRTKTKGRMSIVGQRNFGVTFPTKPIAPANTPPAQTVVLRHA